MAVLFDVTDVPLARPLGPVPNALEVEPLWDERSKGVADAVKLDVSVSGSGCLTSAFGSRRGVGERGTIWGSTGFGGMMKGSGLVTVGA